MAPSNKAHVAVLAFPFSSHPSALFFLARRLAEWAPDVAFSFFCTPKANGSLSSWPTLPNLRIYDVADGLPEGHVSKGRVDDEIDLFLGATPGNYREAVKRVEEIEKVSCVVSDAFLWFAREMAEEMGVAWVAFWIAGACALSVHLNTDLIRRKIGTRSEEVSARMDDSLAFIPGCSQFRVRDLPEGIVFGPLDFSLFKSLHRMSQELPRATAILVNTIEEVDYDPVLDHLRTVLNKCLPVGPLTLLAPTRPDSDSDPHSCLPWLEAQAHNPASVAYVGFGTVIVPPPSELAALAEALEESGVHFLWSLKDNMREALPAGFLDRTHGRGLVVPWTPQSKVLEHVAVGAFINHCGWNSVLESIAFGVPMIYRPFFADHRINARILSQVLGIAVEVKGGVLTKDGVMDGLDLLLEREEGKKMRERIGALKLIAKNAVGETGSSTKNLKAALEIIGALRLNRRIYDVADGLPEGHVSEGRVDDEIDFFLGATPGNYRDAVKSVDEIEKVSCVVSDAFLWFAREMAEEMGVAWMALWTAGACSLLVHLNTDLIRRMIGTRSEEVSARMDESLAFIPGCSQFRVRDLPDGIVFGPLDFSLFKSLHRMSLELPRATAVLVNTIEEMDYDPVLDHLRTVLNKCLPVGPVTLLAPTRPDSDSDPHSCLPWLEARAHDPASVAYVGFGTVIKPPPSELAALAEALEESGVHFLWSLKDDMRESLPAGFLDRTSGRGLVVPWTPQSKVLGHVAVGAFINHCGWKSVVESIASGVPMIYRPFFADQRINARLLSQVLGIAVEVKGGVLTKDGVMDGLDLLLKREEGKKIRQRIGALKLIAKNAVGESGSSTKNLKTALEIIRGSAA